MEPAIRNIVEACVHQENRKALRDLLAHRKRIIAGLNDLACDYDTSKSIAQCEEDIALVEAALTKLKWTIRARAKGIKYRGREPETKNRPTPK